MIILGLRLQAADLVMLVLSETFRGFLSDSGSTAQTSGFCKLCKHDELACHMCVDVCKRRALPNDNSQAGTEKWCLSHQIFLIVF